jgi:hypothetical protein
MKFGRLAGNNHINARIYECLAVLHPSDVSTFVRKFRTESNEQRFHTYRELILGHHLRNQGLNLRYGQRIRSVTPDWVLFSDDGDVSEILDVVSLHQRRATENAIAKTVASGRLWTGWSSIPADHIYSKIHAKARSYAELAAQLAIPYTIALFSEFFASLKAEEVRHVLHDLHGGVFAAVDTLSGLIFFREHSGRYEFTHFPNQTAACASIIVKHG